MNIEFIRELAAIVSANGLTALEVNEGDTKILIEKGGAYPVAEPSPLPQPIMSAPDGISGKPVDSTINFNRLIEVRSPMVGVFYSSPSPDSEQFVRIGSKVQKGDVLCIIESMKLMNEIAAEQDGEIIDIHVKNGDIVEFDQVMFRMN